MSADEAMPPRGVNNRCNQVRSNGAVLSNRAVVDGDNDIDCEGEDDREAMTCSVLCSLMNTSSNCASLPPPHLTSSCNTSTCDRDSQMSESDYCDNYGMQQQQQQSGCKRRSSESCTEHLQLPMFLSKTYHMIDRCDRDIAMWSEKGDNFVVKNVEKFASHVLPLYFKHSNFSSFARQLNFYGFRKLRTDPILTSDVDPCTSSYVRFYHEKFQRGKPDLLQHIKRATKTDQHSKDDIESLRNEVADIKDLLRSTVEEYDRKLAELSYDCNRRISAMTAEYDQLAAMVHRMLGMHPSISQNSTSSHIGSATPALLSKNSNSLMSGSHHMSSVHSPSASSGCPNMHLRTLTSSSNYPHNPMTTSTPTLTSGQVSSSASSHPIQMSVNADLLHSLSQAAVSLQNSLRAQQQHHQQQQQQQQNQTQQNHLSANSGDCMRRLASSCSEDRPESPRSWSNRES